MTIHKWGYYIQYYVINCRGSKQIYILALIPLSLLNIKPDFLKQNLLGILYLYLEVGKQTGKLTKGTTKITDALLTVSLTL